MNGALPNALQTVVGLQESPDDIASLSQADGVNGNTYSATSTRTTGMCGCEGSGVSCSLTARKVRGILCRQCVLLLPSDFLDIEVSQACGQHRSHCYVLRRHLGMEQGYRQNTEAGRIVCFAGWHASNTEPQWNGEIGYQKPPSGCARGMNRCACSLPCLL